VQSLLYVGPAKTASTTGPAQTHVRSIGSPGCLATLVQYRPLCAAHHHSRPVRSPSPLPPKPVRSLAPPTRRPTTAPVRPAIRQAIPSICQVELLITLMDMAVDLNKAIAPQWLRLAFHDTVTFNMQEPEGGPNGCLLKHDAMRAQPVNRSLVLAIRNVAFYSRANDQHSHSKFDSFVQC
jgi:Peroxidase